MAQAQAACSTCIVKMAWVLGSGDASSSSRPLSAPQAANGRLSQVGSKSSLKSAGPSAAELSPEVIFAYYDRDKDGILTKESFSSMTELGRIDARVLRGAL